MSFLSNFNILERKLLGPTDVLESNEDMEPSTLRVLGISAELFLIFRIDFMPRVFLMLF